MDCFFVFLYYNKWKSFSDKGISMSQEFMPHHKARQLQEHDVTKMLQHYRFSEADAMRLKRVYPLAKASLPKLKPGFYDFIFSFAHAQIFLHSSEILSKHELAIGMWFLNLFSGTYDEAYFNKLNIISETHVRIGLPPHYVNAAFSYVREFIERLMMENDYDVESLASVNKIIDINLDILSLSYREEEQQQLIEDIVLLKDVLRSGTILPYVQPIIKTSTGEISKFECLMRLKDPKNGSTYSIFPYLKTAKSVHLYEGLMELMVEKSMRIFETLPWPFSLNLSYEDIGNRRFRNYVSRKIQEFPDPERIIFEVLETDFIEDFDVVSSFLDDMRSFGCKVAIDDFGSGYSSMENILKLKPDFIKIDGSLIHDIDHSSQSLAIVKGVISMVKELEVESVAEYVHNEEVHKVVCGLGIDYLQGYYLGRPFPADQLLKE